jgi:subtilisin family serine protease
MNVDVGIVIRSQHLSRLLISINSRRGEIMKKQTMLLLTTAFVFLASMLMPQSQGAAFQGQSQQAPAKFRKVNRAIPNQYNVALHDVDRSDVNSVAANLAQAHGGSLRFVFADAIKGFTIEIPEAAAIALSKNPQVKYVEENGEASIADTQFSPPWGLDRIDQRDMPLSGSYTFNATGAGVSAFVIDTGIRTTHQQFGGRAVAVFDSFGGNGQDCNGHGTHVAGILGGSTFGVAKNVSLFAVRVLDCAGNGDAATIAAGVNFVTGNHGTPAVANMSLRLFGISQFLDDAVRGSIASGVTYVFAAGNENSDARNFSPPRVAEGITVGATGNFESTNPVSDQRASFSNWGPVLDIFAPGVGIPSAWIGSDTDSITLPGTSMAAPHVAGVAALFLQGSPGSTPAIVQSAITSNATVGKVIDPAGSPNLLLFSIFNGPPQLTTGQPVPADYDGDNRDDLSMKLDDGRWQIDFASNGFGVWDATFSGYGSTTARPVPRDYDGDGRADLSVKTNSGAWSIDFSGNGFGAFDVTFPGYGGAESRPAPADYDGDGRADLSCHETNRARWRIDYSSNGYGVWDFDGGGYGFSENRETPADYDGDGRADISVHSITQGRWAIDYAWNGFGSWHVSYGGFGFSENREVPADYDGDGRADISVRSDTGQNWVIDYAWDGLGTWNVGYNGYGGADSIPLAADYDGDGRADLSIKTSDGRWLIDYASNGFGTFDQTIVLQ